MYRPLSRRTNHLISLCNRFLLAEGNEMISSSAEERRRHKSEGVDSLRRRLTSPTTNITTREAVSSWFGVCHQIRVELEKGQSVPGRNEISTRSESTRNDNGEYQLEERGMDCVHEWTIETNHCNSPVLP